MTHEQATEITAELDKANQLLIDAGKALSRARRLCPPRSFDGVDELIDITIADLRDVRIGTNYRSVSNLLTAVQKAVD